MIQQTLRAIKSPIRQQNTMQWLEATGKKNKKQQLLKTKKLYIYFVFTKKKLLYQIVIKKQKQPMTNKKSK